MSLLPLNAWPLEIGERHAVYGVVVALGFTGGERYYWFQRLFPESGGADFAMIPASAIVRESWKHTQVPA